MTADRSEVGQVAQRRRLLDRDLYATDPHPFFAELRAHEPVYCDDTGMWALTKLEDIRWAERQPRLFSSARGSRPNGVPQPSMIDSDDPLHADQRRIVQRGFTPRQMAAYEDHVRAVARRLVDGIVDRGECDVVADLAKPLPMTLIGEMLGAPESDYDQLQRWSDQMISGADGPENITDEVITAAFEYHEYISKVIAERKANPGDDLVSQLVHADVNGEVMADERVVGNALLLLVGGNETTRNVITGGLEAMLRNPDQLAHTVGHLDDVTSTVEECLRWVTPIVNMNRVTTSDVEVRGVTIPEGSQVLMCYISANRDEDVFHEPFRFDVTRDPNPHIAFGWGPHLCLGAALARLEIRTILTELLSRVTDLRLAEPEAPLEYSHSSFVRGIQRLPVTFRAA
jgi:cytochrome P450 family 142 subfamily A polypeptide 1